MQLIPMYNLYQVSTAYLIDETRKIKIDWYRLFIKNIYEIRFKIMGPIGDLYIKIHTYQEVNYGNKKKIS